MRGVALALMLVAALAPASRADDRLRVGKASPTAIAMLPLEVGAREGIFKRHGIAVVSIDFEGGAKLHQAMAAGAIDIGIGAGPELAFVAKGSPELAVANPAGPPLFIGVIVPAGSPVKSAEDLKGAKIGVSTVNSMTYWMALELARHEGWGPGGVTPVAIGSQFAAIIAAFRTHEIDAEIAATSLGFQLQEQNRGRVLLPVSDFVGNMSADTIFASKHLIATNPDAIRRFLAGWFDTVSFMRANKEETVQVARVITGFSQDVQDHEYDQAMPMFNEDGRFDAQSLATLKRSFAALKLLDFAPDMSTLYTEEFLPQR